MLFNFLQLKLEMLDRLKDIMSPNDTLKLPKLELQFCRNNMTTRLASSTFLPIMFYQCPSNFSTIEYFEVIFVSSHTNVSIQYVNISFSVSNYIL